MENLKIFDLNGGTTRLLTSDSPAKEFYRTLLQQLDNQEGAPVEERYEGAGLSSHRPAELLPFTPPQSRESSSSEGFDALFQLTHLTLLPPFKAPIPAETGVVEPSIQPPSENGWLDRGPTLLFIEEGKWSHSLKHLNEYPTEIDGLSNRQASEACAIPSAVPVQAEESLKCQTKHFREVSPLLKERGVNERFSLAPLLGETPEKIDAKATGSYMGQPSDLIHQKPLFSQELKGGLDVSASMPAEAEETAFDQSMIKRSSPESFPGEINRTPHRPEHISSPSHLKRDERGAFLGANGVEKTDQGPSFFSDPNPISFNRGASDQPFPFEWKDQAMVRPSLSHAQLDDEDILFSKNLSRFSDFPFSQKEALSQGSIPQGQYDPVLLRGETKAQPIDSTRVEFFERIGQAITWSVQKGAERIAMRLEPPELGTLFIRLEKDKEVLKATLWAEHQATKELLEIHRQDLRRILEADGFKLERFEVYVEQDTDRFLEERAFSFLERRQGHGRIEENTAMRISENSETHSLEDRRYLEEGRYIDRII